MRVEVVAPVGSRLFVNGRPATLDEKARFETTATPGPRGLVVFKLLQRAAESYTVRSVSARRAK